MDQKELYREMAEIMGQLSVNRQRYLLELARASKRAERWLSGPNISETREEKGGRME